MLRYLAMKILVIALLPLLAFAGNPALADEASPRNSQITPYCNYIVGLASRSDFVDCESNHRNNENCLRWARQRRSWLENNIGARCEQWMRQANNPDGRCRSRGKEAQVLFHIHRGLECTYEKGCTGRDGKPPPHDHWESVHFQVVCR